MLNEIKISDKVSIYQTNISYDKETILKEIKLNIDINARSSIVPRKEAPGLQSDIIIRTKGIDAINRHALNILSTELNCNVSEPYYHHCWIYKSTNSNIYENYHKHLSIQDFNLNNIAWTHTFYVQMPDNLEGDDGYLLFKTDDGIEYKMLPKEGDLIIFSAGLSHMPKTNKKSNIERVVLGGAFKSLNLYDKIIKEQKSLI